MTPPPDISLSFLVKSPGVGDRAAPSAYRTTVVQPPVALGVRLLTLWLIAEFKRHSLLHSLKFMPLTSSSDYDGVVSHITPISPSPHCSGAGITF